MTESLVVHLAILPYTSRYIEHLGHLPVNKEAEIAVTIAEPCTQQKGPYSEDRVECRRIGESIPARAERFAPK